MTMRSHPVSRKAAVSGRLRSWLAGLLCLMALTTASCSEQETDFLPAPDFPKSLQWINVANPLSLADLRGKVVILDFWTYGCINCIHVMDELARLRERFGHKIAVIGVHSPKFDNEANPETLRSILVRYQRDEPVVNDPDYLMMRSYGVRAWPTLAVIDPAGGYVGRVSGEGHEERLATAIEKLLDLHEGAIDETPIALSMDEATGADGWFGAPEKITVGGGQIAVSDSQLNHILITDMDGRILHRIGSGEPGFSDGNLSEARFRAPRGMVFDNKGVLYVADTGNHAIRKLDLKAGRVTTIAGTGRKGLRELAGTDPLTQDLRSPWDLALEGTRLYIAMAGDHQIWRMDLAENRLGPYAGSGGEGIDDGDLEDATFSQPSSLTLADGKLYVADPEASAIREIDLEKKRVHTLVGTGLFDFGDRDGSLSGAQLQHALGVAYWEDRKLLVADTYNHKLKLIDLESGKLSTLLGNGEPGSEIGRDVRLNEPGGLAIAGDRILIADTNNGRILDYDPESGRAREWNPVKD
jgi:thiol-disulfide isomerase/thioredoxin